MSDNSPALIADQFHEFLNSNNVKHVRFADFNPQTNGKAKRLVQKLKREIKSEEQEVSNYKIVRFVYFSIYF